MLGNTKVFSKMVRKKVMEFSHGKMVIDFKEIMIMMLKMGKEKCQIPKIYSFCKGIGLTAN
jgi:hypothetical protein